MQDPQAYFANIAQMILQSAQAGAAQEEERVRREQELRYRNEQLSLERERMADQRRMTDAQLENASLDREAKQLSLKRIKRDDAMEYVRGEEAFLQTGEYPDQTDARMARQDASRKARMGEAQVATAEAEAASAPERIGLSMKREQAGLDAAASQKSLADFQLEESKTLSDMNRRLLAGQIRAAELKNTDAALDVAKKRTDNFFASRGQLPPEQAAVMNAQMRQRILSGYLNVVEKSAEKIDASGAVTIDPGVFASNMAEFEKVADLALKFEVVKSQSPEQARLIQSQVRSIVDGVAKVTSDPRVIGNVMTQATKMALDSVKKPAATGVTTEAPSADNSERGLRLKRKSEREAAVASAPKAAIATFIEKMNDDDFAKIERIFPGLSKEAMAEKMYPYWTEAQKELRAGSGGGMYPNFGDDDVMRLALDKALRGGAGKK